MSRKIMDAKMWSDVAKSIMDQATGILETKGLTEEEEQEHLKKTFEEIAALGYSHIRSLKVVPLDSERQPYIVRIDNVDKT